MGIAIIGILFCHFRECMEIHHVAAPALVILLSRGICGVDIFMILSGLGLYYSYTNNQDLRLFYKKRFIRLLPAYLIVAGSYFYLNDIVIKHTDFKTFATDLLFVTFFTKGTSIFWFIPAVIVFYLFFPAIRALLFGSRSYIIKSPEGRTCLLLLFTAALDVMLSRILPIYSNISIMLGRFPAFIIGIYLGYKSYNKARFQLISFLLIPLIKILTSVLYRIPKMNAILSNLNIHYLDTLLALLVLEIILLFFNYVKPFDIFYKILKWFGTITLEVYLFHMAMLSVFHFPAATQSYLLFCVGLPVLSGFLLNTIINKTTGLLTTDRGHQAA